MLILFRNVTLTLVKMLPNNYDIISSWKGDVFLYMHNKEYALKLVQDKINGLNNYSYSQIGSLTGYTKVHIIRLSKELNN